MSQPRKLTFREKVDLVPAFASIGGAAIVAPVTGLFRGPDGADTYRHHIANSIIKKFNSRLNSLQAQAIQPSFENTYKKWCKSNGQVPDIVHLDSLKGFWIGDKEQAKYIVVYFHGGGFALPGSKGHLDFWFDVQQHLSRSSLEIAFFFVSYTLTPHALWPCQLRESIAAVQYLVEECHVSPNRLILGGDSAGGNLAVATLLHMSEPCPEVENNFTIKGSFKALILMAPWVSFDTTGASFENNKAKDFIEAAVESRWSAEYMGDVPNPDETERGRTKVHADTHPYSSYAEPSLATSDAWFGAKCDKMLVVYGSVEALQDSIEEWAETYKKGVGQSRVDDGAIEVLVSKNEVHIAPMVWPMFGDTAETQTGVNIKKWMIENLLYKVDSESQVSMCGKSATLDR